MKSLEIKQWSFFFGALLACGAFSLLASTPEDVAPPAKRNSGEEVVFASTSEVADLGSMIVASARVELGSMTVTATRVRWV